MSTTDDLYFTKQPSEQYTIGIDFTNRLPTGATVASATVTALDLSLNATDTSVLGSTTATVTTTTAKVLVKTGTDGKDYKITFLATLSDASILEEDREMRVRAI